MRAQPNRHPGSARGTPPAFAFGVVLALARCSEAVFLVLNPDRISKSLGGEYPDDGFYWPLWLFVCQGSSLQAGTFYQVPRLSEASVFYSCQVSVRNVQRRRQQSEMKGIKVKPLFYFSPEVFSSCNLLQHDISAILLEAKVSVFIPPPRCLNSSSTGNETSMNPLPYGISSHPPPVLQISGERPSYLSLSSALRVLPKAREA